jgi:imidazoleglycerol-phosphate dehydratase/histidinol-phosphatase
MAEYRSMDKIAFVDRDGTFLWEPERPAGVDPRETFPLKSMKEFQFMDGAKAGLKKLVENGYKLVMVTNQTFLGSEKHPRQMFDNIMERLQSELASEGVRFDFIMVCPHGPDEGCDCRKPQTGGVQGYIDSYPGQIDFARSLMFGDRATDGEFAENLGVRFVKIETNQQFVLPDDIF